MFGEGPAGAPLLFIGEQPGDQEDIIGRPFVGPAGQMLDRALEEAGIDRRTIYITNAVNTSNSPRAAPAASTKPRKRRKSRSAASGWTSNACSWHRNSPS